MTSKFVNGGVFNLYELANWTNGIAFRDVNFTLEGMPVIKIAEMKSGISESTGLTTDEFDEKYRITSGDLLFSWSGSPKTSIFPLIWQGPEGWLNQHIFKVVPKEGISQEYLHLLLIYLNRELIFLASNRMTTGLGHVTKSDLERLRVNLPSKKERMKIVRIAYPFLTLESELKWSFDAAESIIQNLFKSWFIDFNPVKAKSKGKLPYGMDEETAALFPDSFEDSELGPIPTGWRVGTISEFGKIVTGRTPSSKNPEHFDGPVPFITIPDLGRKIWQDETERTISQAGAEALKSAIIPANSVCVSCIATVGNVGITTRPSITNQQIHSIVCEEGYSGQFVYSMMASFVPNLKFFAGGGAVVQNISKSMFGKQRVVIPPTQVVEQFNEIVEHLYQNIQVLNSTSRRLIATRDTILPRLMSGELGLPVEA